MTSTALTARLDIDRVLASIDTMTSNKPVAAQLVAMTSSDDFGAKELADMLAGDLALSGRVLKLANSAYFGMRGRVTSLQFAVTVVGFMTIRTLTTVALTDLEDESRLPEDFWLESTHLAQAAATLAPRFGERPPDALCLGLLSQLGTALLHHHDPEGYNSLLEAHISAPARRLAETRSYGFHALELSAVAIERWGFPARMVTALRRADDLTSLEGALLRVATEVASRLSSRPHEPVTVGRLCGGLIGEEAIDLVVERVRLEAEELRMALLP